ncbi:MULTISPECIES: heparan-alpha-glucosaminide N-acetyltransferase domain-containing protein [unclassified Microcoleus]|uniref:heparan-alpha-glucosaminide N-acetyltransferase domain-containing protein n=1 Tax=unclassified Microcoleus TaxID=2642155 RepID=UPI002FD5A428
MRFKSLDVFRGIAIASMILVNNPGSWEQVYPPLKHAEWHGCTPTDLVFPFFLFIVGCAMSFSLSKYIQNYPKTGIETSKVTQTKEKSESAKNPLPSSLFLIPASNIYWRIARRAAILFLLGLLLNTSSIALDVLLNSAPVENFGKIRIMGVLQRIGLAYFISAIAILNLSPRNQKLLAVAVLLGYWGALTVFAVGGYTAGELTPEGNLGGYVDRLILGSQHLYKGGPFDPEGLLSTLPAVVTVLIGYFTGEWLRVQPIKTRTSINLAICGLSCAVIGHLWGFLFPINKQLWTSSYVVFTAGWALLLLAACYETIEVRDWKWGRPFEIMGVNAIFLFVASGIVARILLKTHIGTGANAPTTYTWIYENWFLPWAGPLNGSLAFAVTAVLFWWLILYGMYRRGWAIKI